MNQKAELTGVQTAFPVEDREPFATAEDVAAVFRAGDELDGPGAEPDWSEHLRAINASRADLVAGT